jgi:hypothetical protein
VLPLGPSFKFFQNKKIPGWKETVTCHRWRDLDKSHRKNPVDGEILAMMEKIRQIWRKKLRR